MSTDTQSDLGTIFFYEALFSTRALAVLIGIIRKEVHSELLYFPNGVWRLESSCGWFDFSPIDRKHIQLICYEAVSSEGYG